MTPSARRDAILHKARSGQKLEVEALALQFAASRETIRRDLAKLDGQGLLRRVHGGATATGRAVDEGPFHDRMRQQVAAKRAIARHVALGLMPGDSLFIDTGSTTLILAEEIAQRKGLIIITNSADIAALCEKGEGNRVLLIGGEFRAAGRETVGPLAVAQIAQLRAARAILTVAAVSERGIFDVDPQEAEVARAMVAQADEVTVLADASKMGRTGVFEVCPMAKVGRIVTDSLPLPLRRAIEAVGVQVEIVNDL
jgi:DeoR family glycerol-3-phosphate regulon repressor